MDKEKSTSTNMSTSSDTPSTNQTDSLVIAVDGPAASGKGTLARQLAKHFGVPYLDTGKLYRAAAWKVLEKSGDIQNVADAVNAAKNLQPTDISSPNLFSEAVGNAASIVSAIPEVRQALLEFQRNFADRSHGGVLDGRDIGTVICPDANVKLFVTANLDARAQRRYQELKRNGLDITIEEMRSNLKERDERDAQRQIAPLAPAEDAWQIDTSDMDAEEVFQVVLSKIDDMLSSATKN